MYLQHRPSLVVLPESVVRIQVIRTLLLLRVSSTARTSRLHRLRQLHAVQRQVLQINQPHMEQLLTTA